MNVLRSSAANHHRHFCLLVALAGLLAGLGGSARSAPEAVRLRGHMPRLAISRAHLVEHVAPEETVSLALALPLRDPDGMNTFLRRLYDPANPFPRQYLSTEQATERYGPTRESYAAVLAFARARGLTVTATYPNRLLVDVAGPARAVEAAFGVHLLRYQAEDGRLFRAPDDDPAIPAALVGRLSGVIGLSDAAHWRTHLVRQDAARELLGTNSPGPTGSGPGGGLAPSDITAAYNLNGSNVPETGKGQTLGLFELDGYTPSDIANYEKTFNLPAVPLQNILLDGVDGTPGAAADEVTLDLEMMVSLASGATQILVYEGPNSGQGVADTYNRIAADNLAKEISTSFGIPENDDKDLQSFEATAFALMRAQGQSIYAASGDSGAYDNGTPSDNGTLSVDDPASQPDMCGVGGTTLLTNGTGGSYAVETAWSDPTDTRRSASGAGGGGGVSDIVSLPDYQTGVFTQTVNPQGSTTNRNVPDVSLNADPRTGYSVYLTDPVQGSGFFIFGGTSAAAPLWAAFTALVNQRREANGEADLGFANPTLYGLLATPGYAAGFHDIADGSTNLFYKTVPGYDNATGLGSFNGAGLLAVVAPPPTVSVTVATLTLKPTAVVGGLTSTASLTLSGPAPAGGVSVTLTSGTPSAATVPASVLVAAGASDAQFTVTTLAVPASTPVKITATLNGGSASATLTVNAPPKTIIPQTLALVPASVCGGDPSVATLTLNGPAPAGGLSVTLTSDNPAAVIPPTVIVPAGATSATITVQTTMLTAAVVANLAATANGAAATAALTVQAPVPQPLTLAPNKVKGGTTAVGTITLTCPAPPGGAAVTLSSDNPAASVAPSVTIPAGGTTSPFTITTIPVAADLKATLSISYGGITQPAPLVIQAPALIALAVSPGGVVGAATATGTVTLDTPAPVGGLTVGLSSTSFAAAVPLSVVVPAGATSATFTVTTLAVSTQNAAAITATFGSVALSQTLTLVPIQVSALTLSQSNLLVGGTATATVTLSAPAPVGGLAVALSSSGPAASLPASATVPAGATTATVTVTAAQPGSAQIAAALGGASQTASLSATAAPGTSFPGGLNLLSVPYDYTGQPLDPLFGFAGVKLAVWQPSAGQYALSPTAPADDPHPGIGFWVRLPGPLSLSHAGKPVDPKQNFSIPLQAGWNQIGDPFVAPVRLGSTQCVVGSTPTAFDAATVTAPPLLSSLVYRYDQKSGYVWVRSSESLVPGLGYWLYAYQNCTLVVPHP